jgi:hypothetical protein
MATPAEQLEMARQNLAAAQAAGDTAKIASGQNAVEYYQSVVNANNGIGPNEAATNGVPNTSTQGAVATPDGGFTDTNGGYTSTFNDKGELIDTRATTAAPAGDPTTVDGYGVAEQGSFAPTNPSPDPTTIEGYGVNEIGKTDPSKVFPDGFGGYVNGQGEIVDAKGVPIRPEVPAQTSTPTTPQKSSIGQDWRVRLSLAPRANYLYKQEPLDFNDILHPLKYTEGVIFPYLPQITVSYKANYNATDITHTNYKNYFYTNSSVDEIQITADFTAQDNVEAKYMLAVIHFFKSVTKMFYGQDSDPRGGTPPPLCYLTGLGAYQFNNHPLVIGSFGYTLPNDVDYIRTESTNGFTGGGITNIPKNSPPKGNGIIANALSKFRLNGAKVNKGATPSTPNFKSITTAGSGVTYVPSKLTIQLAAYPVVTRQDISNNFKLNGKDGYGSGALTKKGIW